MNKQVMDFLSRKMRMRHEDRNDSRDMRGDMRRYDRADERRRDYTDSRRDYNDERDGGYHDGDYRRDRADYGYDRSDYAYDREDMRDYGGMPIRLTKKDIKAWKSRLENADGTRGEHFEDERILQTAEHIGIKYHGYDEREFCMVVNMMYSDYCRVIKKHLPPEKELTFCCELAKAFLEDPDAPEPSEKLALYFHCIADD